jgi:hypothetical protein
MLAALIDIKTAKIKEQKQKGTSSGSSNPEAECSSVKIYLTTLYMYIVGTLEFCEIRAFE